MHFEAQIKIREKTDCGGYKDKWQSIRPTRGQSYQFNTSQEVFDCLERAYGSVLTEKDIRVIKKG